MFAYSVPMTFESKFYLASDVKVHGTRKLNNGDIVWIIQPHDVPHTTFWAYRMEIPE